MATSTYATPYGYRTVIDPEFTTLDAIAWFEDVKRVVGLPHRFGQLVDLRQQRSSSDETKAVVEAAMRWVRAQGLERSAVIVSSIVTKVLIMRFAVETGMYTYERYFDSSGDLHWEQKALAWIEHGTDPDL
jgi:hypothetical protein